MFITGTQSNTGTPTLGTYDLVGSVNQHGTVPNTYLARHHFMDPWCSGVNNEAAGTEFEDDFKPNLETQKLNDSAEYLALLERKLKAVKSKSKVVENLSAYREDCINRLMRDGCDLDPVIGDTEGDRLIDEKN
ncbi:Uncharacterized protein OBRU01_22177 [Operophtera brumata]|uniref:Uncharacterized protein n=1 Tax=Operophtera brumata TaxID=104452 RepID=A0A0L7KS37_OPEBR|nr:Uncharacterized protein OBRU01_22177 [Operophtera brumata]